MCSWQLISKPKVYRAPSTSSYPDDAESILAFDKKTISDLLTILEE